jgi:N6-adenosine-specific RNA methylase IME4
MKLAKLNVERRLAACRTLDEAKDIRDKAEAVRVYAKLARKGLEIQNHAAFVKIQAERRAGELASEIERAQGKNGSGLRAALARSGVPIRTAYRWQLMARVPETRIRELWLDATEQHEEFTSATIYREALSYVNPRKPTPPMAAGVYRVLYADPPWSYGGGCFTPGAISSGAERHYRTMALDDICNIKLPGIAEDAVLFLWAPSPQLENAFKVLAAWSFEYKQSFVWHKLAHNFGWYNSVRHELLLIATRGSCVPDSKELIPSVQSIERTEHSRKPEAFRSIIDRLYTHGERIELFARGTLPPGWQGFGNEYGACG